MYEVDSCGVFNVCAYINITVSWKTTRHTIENMYPLFVWKVKVYTVVSRDSYDTELIEDSGSLWYHVSNSKSPEYVKDYE